MAKIEELWCVKDGVHRVRVARVTEQRSKRLGALTVYRGESGWPTYRESDIKRWDDLTRDQQSRAYRDWYEAKRADAIWQAEKDPSLSAQCRQFMRTIYAERDAALSALDRGETVSPPPHIWE